MHEDILTSQSKPFQQATAGPWHEAVERKILLTDWDADTVARLVEFLYRDDYAYPDPIGLEPTEPDAPVRCLSPIPPDTLTDSERLEPFNLGQSDFGSVLLAHARVCVLANYKAVERLRALALSRVELVLACLEPLQAGYCAVRNVAEFAGYVYAHTDPVAEKALRKMASDFIARNVVAFQQEPRAVELMAGGGDLVTDVMAEVCRRLVDPSVGSWTPVKPKIRYVSDLKVSGYVPQLCGSPTHRQPRSCSEALGYCFLTQCGRWRAWA